MAELGIKPPERVEDVDPKIMSLVRDLENAKKEKARASVTPERTYLTLTAAFGALENGILALDDIRDGLDEAGLIQFLTSQYGHLLYAEGGMQKALEMVQALLEEMDNTGD